MKTLNEATTDELFTALMKKVQQENPHHCYYIDALTVEPYPTWTMHHVNPEGHEEFYNIVAKEVEISDCNLH